MSANPELLTIRTHRQSAVSYWDVGTGEPLLLLHGTQGDLTGFRHLLSRLGPGIRALPYTQRDIDMPHDDAPAPYGMTDIADDCVALLDALGLDTAHILGASFGGGLAMHVASRYPDRVRSLILTAAPPSWAMVEPLAPGFSSEDPEIRKQAMRDALVSPEVAAADPDLVGALGAIVIQPSPEQVARRMAALTSHDATGGLAAITAPTLVLHGAHDPLITADTARWVADRISGSRLVVLENARHGVLLHPADEAATIVRDFVLEHA